MAQPFGPASHCMKLLQRLFPQSASNAEFLDLMHSHCCSDQFGNPHCEDILKCLLQLFGIRLVHEHSDCMNNQPGNAARYPVRM